MALDLSKPFSWKSAAGDMKTVLQGLQPNILKGHTREFLTILLLEFNTAPGGKAFLKALAPFVKSALTHLKEVDAFNAGKRKHLASPPPGTSYVGVGISADGYAKLGIPVAKRPPDRAFRAGMKAAALNDPAVTTWDKEYQSDIHAIVLVGDAKPGPRNAMLGKVQKLINANPAVRVVGIQKGQSQHNGNGDGIEHFGYVDGRSQPLFFNEDVEHEQFGCDGTSNWNPGFGPNRAIVPDPAAPKPALQFGSYFILRKLEQNVHKFKSAEKGFATKLGLKGDKEQERAGAMIVGRFEDGTPVTSQFADGAHNPVQNNFNYDSDGKGGKCPFFGHIRKMNPRGSGGVEVAADERMHIMPRRGQTYGTRTDDLNDGKIFNKPTGDVGLLFMAFNANLGEQFEFVQKFWANSAGFPSAPKPPGLDMVIGQGVRPPTFANIKWGEKDAPPVAVAAIPQSVTMKGGEYFFMPSLPFLASL